MNRIQLVFYQTTIVLLVWIVHSFGLTCNNGVGTPDPERTYAYGRGLQSAIIDSPANFKVQLVNSYGNNLTFGGALVTATIMSPEGDNLVFISSDNQDGSYSFSYSPSVAGAHSIQILLEDTPILHTQFFPVALNTELCATNEIESGAYLQSCAKPEQKESPMCLEYSENACCNRDHVADIGGQLDQLSVQYGSSSTCMDFFESAGCGINCAPNQKMFMNTVSSLPATISICAQFCSSWYQACQGVPSFNNSITQGEWCSSQFEIEGFDVIVSSVACFGGSPTTSSPSLSFIEDLEGGFVFVSGTQYTLTIQTVDVYGNLLDTTDGTVYQVQLVHEATGVVTDATVTDNNDGTYSAIFTPVKASGYQVSIQSGNLHVINSPFEAFVIPGTASKVTTVNLITNHLEDQPQIFMIITSDANDNVISKGEDKVTATLNGTRASYVVGIADNCNGTYTAEYDATIPDTYSLLVFIDKVMRMNTTIIVNSVPRPRVINGEATITDLGTAIKIDFSEDTDRAGIRGNFNCTILIEENVFGSGVSQAMLPNFLGSYCSWADDSTLIAHLGCSYTVTPGSHLTLRAGLVKPADGTSSSLRQQFTVLAPKNPPVPQIIFRGPSHASKCGTLNLSAEQSMGTAGMRMQFTWQLQSDDPDVTSIYNQYLTGLTNAWVSLPMDNFDSGRTYTFVVTAQNYYNQTATESFDVHVIEEAAPTIVVQPAHITVTTGDFLKLRAEGVLGICDGRSTASNDLTYSWTIRSDEGVFLVEPSATNSAELFITPNSLEAGRSYSFWVRAVGNNSHIYAESEAQVIVMRSPLSVSIQGGNRLHTLGADLFLDASQDFPSARITSENITFEWSCVDTTGKPCFSQNVFQDAPTARIPASYLSLGRLAFTLTASTEEGSASDTVIISADSRKQPRIFIQAPSHISSHPFTLTTLGFPLEGALFVRYEWEMLGSDYTLVDFSDCNITYNGVIFNCRSEATLSVNTAILANGRDYTFGVRAFDSEGNIAVATITRNKNTPPNGGCCTLSTRLGQAYKTLFRIQCLYWEDDDYPLRYAFYRNSSAGLFPLNPGVTFVNYLDFTLPEMVGTVEVHVMDSKGAASIVAFNVNASNVAVTPNALLGVGSYVLKENLKDVLAKGHSDGMLRCLVYLRDYLPTLTATGNKQRDFSSDFVAGITKLLFSIKSEPNSLVDNLKLQIFNEVVVSMSPTNPFLGFPDMVKPLAATGVSVENAVPLLGVLETLSKEVTQVSPQKHTSLVLSSLEYLTRAVMVLLPPGLAQVVSGQTTITVINTLLEQVPHSVQAGIITVHLPPSFITVPDPNQPIFIAVTETVMSLYGWAVFTDRVGSPFVAVSVYQGGVKLDSQSLVSTITIDLATSRLDGKAVCQVWSGRWSVGACVQVNQTDEMTTCECTELPSILSVRDNPTEETSDGIDNPNPTEDGENEEHHSGSGFDLDKEDTALLTFVGGVIILLVIVSIIVSKKKSKPEDPVYLLTKDLDQVHEREDFDWSDVEPVHDYSVDNMSLKDIDFEEDKQFEDYSLGFSETEDDRREEEGPTRAPMSMRLQRLGPGGISQDEKKGYGSTSTHRNSFQTEYDLDSPRSKQSTKPEASTRTLRPRNGQPRPTNQPASSVGRVGGRVARNTPRDSSSSMK